MKTLLVLLIAASILAAQPTSLKENLDQAFTFAQKGVEYAFSNIPDRKSSLNNDLIDNDQLIANVKLSKEVHGVKVESEGYFGSYRIKITLYRSYDKLVEDGYIKYVPEDN